MRLTPEESSVFAIVGRQYPEFVRAIERWRMQELEQLPSAVTLNVGVLQGRAQVLTEMKNAFQPSCKPLAPRKEQK